MGENKLMSFNNAKSEMCFLQPEAMKTHQYYNYKRKPIGGTKRSRGPGSLNNYTSAILVLYKQDCKRMLANRS